MKHRYDFFTTQEDLGKEGNIITCFQGAACKICKKKYVSYVPHSCQKQVRKILVIAEQRQNVEGGSVQSDVFTQKSAGFFTAAGPTVECLWITMMEEVPTFLHFQF